MDISLLPQRGWRNQPIYNKVLRSLWFAVGICKTENCYFDTTQILTHLQFFRTTKASFTWFVLIPSGCSFGSLLPALWNWTQVKGPKGRIVGHNHGRLHRWCQVLPHPELHPEYLGEAGPQTLGATRSIVFIEEGHQTYPLCCGLGATIVAQELPQRERPDGSQDYVWRMLQHDYMNCLQIFVGSKFVQPRTLLKCWMETLATPPNPKQRDFTTNILDGLDCPFQPGMQQ